MPDYPSITYRYPELKNGDVPDLRPLITFDWSEDIDSSQFLDSAKRAQFFSLLEKKDMTTSISVSGVSYDPLKRRITLIPLSDLNRGSRYVCIVNDKVVSTFGRKSAAQYRWEFTTASADVEQVQLFAPAEASVQGVFPNLQWLAVSTSGNVNYQIQLDDRYDFGSMQFSTIVSYNQPATGMPSPLSVTPAGSFDADSTYYWRVRAVTTTATGAWSDTWSFYFGDVRIAHVTSSEAWEQYTPFQVDSVSWKNGLSNQAAFPDLTVVFNKPLLSAPTFNFYVENLLPRNDQPASYDTTILSGSWSGTGAIWTFSPAEAIKNNTKYSLIIPATVQDVNGNKLAEENSFYFTGRYNPYYVHSRTIRARFMTAEHQMPDDFINFQIFRASLDAKARFYGFNMLPPPEFYLGDGLREQYVRDTPNLQSYPALKWVEAATYVNILRAILSESLREVGRKRKQGDYEESLDKGFLDGIKMALDQATQELQQWEQYLISGNAPVSVSRFQLWSDINWDYMPSTWGISRRDDYF